MTRIDSYPHSFKLAGEQWELHKNMIRWVRTSGEENKMSLTGDVVAVAVFEDLDEAVVLIGYPHNKVFHTMGKQSGWKGPFRDVRDIVVQDRQAAIVDADGSHVL